MPDALNRKYPNAATEWRWQWVFPQENRWKNNKTGEVGRHHVHETILQRAVKEAVKGVGIVKHVRCHMFWHSFATHLLGEVTSMRQLAIPLLVLLLPFTAVVLDSDSTQLMEDPGFEETRPGKLETTTTGKGWEVQRIGRPEIQNKLVVECISDKKLAHSGNNFVKLALPKDAVGFEFVTIGQRLKLRADREYEAAVWVRWPDGPEKAPAKANATSGHPSAVVSFWARHKDAKGDFAGRDVWLFDRQWKKLTFRFRATDPDQKTLVYVSLLPNQTPRETTVFVDDFTLTESKAPAAVAKKKDEVVVDGDFSKLKAGPLGFGPTWSFANIGGMKIVGEVIEEQGQKFFRIAMNKNTTNYESAQLWQILNLEKGVRYEVSCRLRWDNYKEGAEPPIVNLGMYHEDTDTWYGPIDLKLKKSKEWETYKFVHIPPYDGKWKLYVGLNGWGNFGNQVIVSCDDFSCKPAE